MKKIYIISLLSLIAGMSWAQPAAFFNRTEADLGAILWKQPVKATFIVTNRGNQPLVINYAETDCGCTIAEWTQTPIEPGKSGEVTATFDAGLLGRFNKHIGLYTNIDEVPYYLSLRGQVVSQLDNYDDTHPYRMGNIRLDKTVVNFVDAFKGDHPTVELHIINTGDAEYTPVMMHLPHYITMEAIPQTLRRKQDGIVRLTLDTDKLTHMGLTQTSIYLSRYIGDKVSEENEIGVSAILLPNFSTLSEAERTVSPTAQLSDTHIEFPQFGKKKKITRTLTLHNVGKSTLKVQELQVSHPALSVTLKKSILAPGESTKLRVTATAKYLKKQQAEARVLLITDDPKNPKLEIHTTINQ